jgi:hypothetical protein
MTHGLLFLPYRMKNNKIIYEPSTIVYNFSFEGNDGGGKEERKVDDLAELKTNLFQFMLHHSKEGPPHSSKYLHPHFQTGKVVIHAKFNCDQSIVAISLSLCEGLLQDNNKCAAFYKKTTMKRTGITYVEVERYQAGYLHCLDREAIYSMIVFASMKTFVQYACDGLTFETLEKCRKQWKWNRLRVLSLFLQCLRGTFQMKKHFIKSVLQYVRS